MIIAQRRLHAQVWPLIALALVALLVASIMARRPQPFARDGLPGTSPALAPLSPPAGAARGTP